MKKTLLIVGLLCAFFNVYAEQQNNLPVERFALYVGCNNGGKTREQLMYAGSDASKFQKTMTELGGIPQSHSKLLINPEQAEILDAFKSFADIINKKKSTSRRTEFIFYYSGHSDENALLLGQTSYDYSSLKREISDVPSDVHVVILDSCFSGNFIRAKGGKRKQAFLTDDSTVVQGHAYLSSSSASESSQESDEIQSSFFTNAMLTGLRGAADTSGDNKVSLNELYYYAFNDTISKTQNSSIGPQHPSYNITLVGSGDLVLTDISQAESTIHIAKDLQGKYIFRNSRGILVSEINKIRGNEVSVALESGSYTVTLITDTVTKEGSFSLNRNENLDISIVPLKTVNRSRNVLRGPAENPDGENSYDGEDEKLTFDSGYENSIGKNAFKFGVDKNWIFTPYNPEYSTNCDITFFRAEDKKIEGVQASVGFCKSLGDVDGMQISCGANVADNVFGAQINAVYNKANNVNGTQVASIFNTADDIIGAQVSGCSQIAKNVMGTQCSGLTNGISESIYGFQISGLCNYAKDFTGFQISGVLNLAESGKGTQWAPVNVAGKMTGFQFGVVNFAREMEGGCAFGLLNIICNGVHDISFYRDTNSVNWMKYQGGTKHFYTSIYGGSYLDDESDSDFNMGYTFAGLGIGTRISAWKFDLDLEVSEKGIAVHHKNDIMKFKDETEATVPSANLTLSFHPVNHIALLGGACFDLEVDDFNNEAFEKIRSNIGSMKVNDSAKLHPSYYVGLRIF